MNIVISNGQSLCYPIKFHDCVQAVFSFNVHTADVVRLLPRDLRPVAMGYGLSELYMFWLQTPASDLGPLSEVQIGIVVEDPFYRRPSSFLIGNPVSSAFAKLASTEMWGLEKSMAELEFVYDGAQTTCIVSMDGRRALHLEGPVLRGPSLDAGTLLCCASPGPSKVFRYVNQAASCGTLERPSNASLRLGDHPLSEMLDKLIRGAPVQRYSYREKSQVMIGPALNNLL